MKLEWRIVKIGDMAFGGRTGVENGCLTIDREELARTLLEDIRLERVTFDLALPGEKCRVVQVLDAIEPRCKVSSGNPETRPIPGQGRTCVLRGAAVVLSDYAEKDENTVSKESHGNIIDMTGPGGDAGPYGRTCNLVVLATPKPGVNCGEYLSALKRAGLKASEYLAAAARDQAPDEIEVFELPALTEIPGGTDRLPRVTYIAQIISAQFEPVPGDPVLFGDQAAGLIPVVVHPNQVLDGAVTSAMPTLNVQTYQIQNHPVIRALYAEHGRSLHFAGVILMSAPNNVADYERMAGMAADLAKWVIGADGAIFTKTAGGAPELTMARTAQECERLGIKTALALLHMGADMKDYKYGAATIFSMPELDALVSMGVPYGAVALASVDRLIGRADPSLAGETTVQIGSILGAMCQVGSSRLTAVRY